MRPVQTQTGTRVSHLGPATKTKSDWSEFIVRPLSCNRKRRNEWRLIRTCWCEIVLISFEYPPTCRCRGLMHVSINRLAIRQSKIYKCMSDTIGGKRVNLTSRDNVTITTIKHSYHSVFVFFRGNRDGNIPAVL